MWETIIACSALFLVALIVNMRFISIGVETLRDELRTERERLARAETRRLLSAQFAERDAPRGCNCESGTKPRSGRLVVHEPHCQLVTQHCGRDWVHTYDNPVRVAPPLAAYVVLRKALGFKCICSAVVCDDCDVHGYTARTEFSELRRPWPVRP